ncbi:YflJ family protein [Bacillus sp. FJAT-29790]|uniref:YflJ family protein n=1 Tax=Bacillus sp. FJAT-29790 TaxID=1895002 RepID=UPI001C220AA3|nr:YflJ family protein [Bacillus sp. FJAT-29790]MBU8878897.1 YflJ family protein [Bacillus sp. FJAT-29790]
MAYQGSKGWYIQKLKEAGMTKHPVEFRKLELYKTFVVRNLYLELVSKDTEK